MKKDYIKFLAVAACLLAVFAAGCSSDSESSSSFPETEKDPVPGETEKTVTDTDTESSTETKFSGSIWNFNELSTTAILGVSNTNNSVGNAALTSAAMVESADVKYSTFGAATDKFSLKADVDYSKNGISGKIKALDQNGVPVQYNRYESSTKDSTQPDTSAGCLQIVKDALVFEDVQGPFTVTLIYGANSKSAKTDGRYAYVKINGVEYDDEAVKNARSLAKTGATFSYEYKGTDKVSITVGATHWVCLYDVRIGSVKKLKTEVSTILYSDGSKEIIKTVTDEDGNIISTETTKIEAPSQSDPQTPGTETPGETGAKPSVNNPVDVLPEYAVANKVGRRSKLNEINVDNIKNAIKAATPQEFIEALNAVQPGGAIILTSDVYNFNDRIRIQSSGTDSALKYIIAANGRAVFDFSEQVVADSSRGIQLEGNYWHLYGITVCYAGDNGILLSGKNNIVERCVFFANQDTGLQLARSNTELNNIADWPSDNLILNCTSYDNADDKTGENADGFAAKLTCGPGNVFDGCIAYANCDDGWDLYAKEATGSIGVVTIKNCVAFRNGMTTKNSSYANGDMNGFKLGGSNGKVPTAHVIYNCLSFNNGKDGFTDNGNGGALKVSGCTAYGNAETNLNFYRTNGGSFYKMLSAKANTSKVDKFGEKGGTACLIEKSLAFLDKKNYYFIGDCVSIFNGDKLGKAAGKGAEDSMFKSVTTPVIDSTVDQKCRNPDGTINMNGLFEIASGEYMNLGSHFGTEAYEVLDVSLEMK